MKRDKSIILTARVVSMIFTPFYLPIVGLIALFTLSYLSQMPLPYKLQVLTMVYLFTILAGVRDHFFICRNEGTEEYNSYPDKNFISAIALGTSGKFAEFVASYSVTDWVGEHKEDQSIGELFVDIYTDME